MGAKWRALVQRLSGLPRSWRELDRSLQLLGTMRSLGWQKSARAGMPLEVEGGRIPWWTYPAIEWLSARIRPTDRVFEYGCGSSTLWLALHAESVVSTEHDETWYEKIRPRLPQNATLVLRPAQSEVDDDLSSPYSSTILEHPRPFDIIVIDGMERNACARHVAGALADEGVVVFDNSHRPGFRAGMECLAKAGLWRIDFEGFAPAYGVRSVTSIFGRSRARWLDASVPLADVGS